MVVVDKKSLAVVELVVELGRLVAELDTLVAELGTLASAAWDIQHRLQKDWDKQNISIIYIYSDLANT